MLNLEIEVPCKPIIKERFLAITSGIKLQLHPRFCFIILDGHRNVAGLWYPGKPVALNTPE